MFPRSWHNYLLIWVNKGAKILPHETEFDFNRSVGIKSGPGALPEHIQLSVDLQSPEKLVARGYLWEVLFKQSERQYWMLLQKLEVKYLSQVEGITQSETLKSVDRLFFLFVAQAMTLMGLLVVLGN